MTDRLKDGGPAFPREYTHKGCSGMSLRDWFAGQALANSRTFFGENSSATPEDVALQAYAVADAMLAERNIKE
jgi:uncharacterized protein YodC (DUF2158 family)